MKILNCITSLLPPKLIPAPDQRHPNVEVAGDAQVYASEYPCGRPLDDIVEHT